MTIPLMGIGVGGGLASLISGLAISAAIGLTGLAAGVLVWFVIFLGVHCCAQTMKLVHKLFNHIDLTSFVAIGSGVVTTATLLVGACVSLLNGGICTSIAASMIIPLMGMGASGGLATLISGFAISGAIGLAGLAASVIIFLGVYCYEEIEWRIRDARDRHRKNQELKHAQTSQNAPAEVPSASAESNCAGDCSIPQIPEPEQPVDQPPPERVNFSCQTPDQDGSIPTAGLGAPEGAEVKPGETIDDAQSAPGGEPGGDSGSVSPAAVARAEVARQWGEKIAVTQQRGMRNVPQSPMVRGTLEVALMGIGTNGEIRIDGDLPANLERALQIRCDPTDENTTCDIGGIQIPPAGIVSYLPLWHRAMSGLRMSQRILKKLSGKRATAGTPSIST
jgi:hypothetical protein